jgi:Glutamine amidotransferase domain
LVSATQNRIASACLSQTPRFGRISLGVHHPREACGVSAPGEPVASLGYYGLYALRHRGQESAGMAVADGRGILICQRMGLVRQVLDKTTLATHQGHLAIGHTRHSATGSSPWENAQPPFTTTAAGGRITIACNGDLTTTAALAGHLIPQESPPGWPVQPRATSDTDVIAQVLARERDLSLEEAIVRAMPCLEALTTTSGPAGIRSAQRLCPACSTERYPIPTPDAAVADLRPSATTQPPTPPLPNPSQRS